MTTINTNISALIAHQTLARNDREMSQAMSRLSTGMRINSAGDDAAGLAIATRMTAQMQGLDQAVRNANDAVSMIQTADGASIELGNIIQRMRVLAVQAISDTYGTSDRAALQAEFVGLQEQLEIIATQTQWNGANLMTGEIGHNGTTTFHIGANDAQAMEVDFGDWRADGFGVYRNGGSTPNNIGPSDLVQTPTTPAVKAVAAVYTSPITDNQAINSSGVMTISDGTNTLTVDASNVNSRSALVTKIVNTPGYHDLLFTVSDNAGEGMNGVKAEFETALTDLDVQNITEDFVLTDSEGNTLRIPGSQIDPMTTTNQLVAAVQEHADYTALNFTVAAFDSLDSGTAADGFVISMKAVEPIVTDPKASIGGVNQNVVVRTPFQAPASAGLDLIYKEAGAVAIAPLVTLEGMDSSLSENAKFRVPIDNQEIEDTADPTKYSQLASNPVPFSISDGTTTVTVADVRNLIHPGFDGTIAGNTDKLVNAIREADGYNSLLFSVSVSADDVNELSLDYKQPGKADFIPRINFGQVSERAAEYETPIQNEDIEGVQSITLTGGGESIRIPASGSFSGFDSSSTVGDLRDAIIGETWTRAKYDFSLGANTGAANTAAGNIGDGFELSDGTTTLLYSDLSSVTNVAQLATEITNHPDYAKLQFSVALNDNSSPTGLTFNYKDGGVVSTPTATGFNTIAAATAVYDFALADNAAAAALADGFAVSDGTTTVTIADMSGVTNIAQAVSAIQGGTNYGNLNFTVAAGGSGLQFTYKAAGAVSAAPTASSLTASVTTAGVTGVTGSISETIAGKDGYSNLPFTVSASDDQDALVFKYKDTGVVASGTSPTVTLGYTAASQEQTLTILQNGGTDTYEQWNLSLSEKQILSAGTMTLKDWDGSSDTTVTVAVPEGGFTSAQHMATVIGNTAGYELLGFTVTSHPTDGLTFTNKTQGNVDGSKRPVVNIAPASGVVHEVISGKNNVVNETRTVVTDELGSDSDPTPEVTRHGITGVEAKAGVPFTPAIDITTSENATAALDNLLVALDGINTQRARFGAAINRLEHTMDNLRQMSSNAAATRGRIQDADYAKESTELARTQIVQQASTAMLTQANASAKTVLELLRG
jgi:flagellin